MTEREALKLALEALICSDDFLFDYHDCEPNNEHEQQRYDLARTQNRKSIESIKEVLAQPEQEPVTWGVDWGRAGQTPCVSIIKRLNDGRIEVVAVEYGPQRTWVGLTDEEIADIYAKPFEIVRMAEAKLKEKNT